MLNRAFDRLTRVVVARGIRYLGTARLRVGGGGVVVNTCRHLAVAVVARRTPLLPQSKGSLVLNNSFFEKIIMKCNGTPFHNDRCCVIPKVINYIQIKERVFVDLTEGDRYPYPSEPLWQQRHT